MKLKWQMLRLAALSCVLFTGIFAISNLSTGHSGKDGGEGFMLAKPAFAQTTEASFLEQEAGIAAYVNVGKAIDLTRAKSAYRTVEKETQNYIVGSVALPSYEAVHDVHLYVQKDGWIVAYYMKGEPTSKIVDWLNYSPGKINTKLKLSLDKMATTLGLVITSVNYYHFGYPAANQLMVIAGHSSFSYTIPAELVVYEGALSYRFEISKSPYLAMGSFALDQNGPQLRRETRHYVYTSGIRDGFYNLSVQFGVDDFNVNVFGKVFDAYLTRSDIAVSIVYQE